MSHTIYAAKFEQTIIHQPVHLRRRSQSHAPAHVLMRLYPIDKSLVCSQSERRTHVRIIYNHDYILPELSSLSHQLQFITNFLLFFLFELFSNNANLLNINNLLVKCHLYSLNTLLWMLFFTFVKKNHKNVSKF